MPKSIIVEGKTTQDAIDKGLKELKVSKNMVEIKTIEEEKKRSFYSILAPRVVKIEMTLKESYNTRTDKRGEKTERVRKEVNINLDEIKRVSEKLKEFFKAIIDDDVDCIVEIKELGISIKINGENVNYLIGFRGVTINALQTLATAVANNYSKSKIMVTVDVADYRQQRAKTLEELAQKLSERVIKTKKTITLEPMSAYERKIIHTKLQDSDKVKTFSKGEEPHRRVVIMIK